MKLPLKWLKEYIDYDVTHEQFVEKMMWRGFEVADVEPEMGEVSGVVVGRIVNMRRHPNSEKLYVCEVDAGEGRLRTIVCGAPNTREGMYAPVALPGAKLPGGAVIGSAAMHGVVSDGMLCSGSELGLIELDYPGSEVNGLLDLIGGQIPGTPIAEATGMDGVVFDIEITPNRPDCQSILGMCREVASALGKPFEEPAIRLVKGEGDAGDYASVTVKNTELCPRYTARVVTDIVIEPSPAWMQKKLISVGLRPINNIVDITNLVMVEYGHPMHAFDLACVAGGDIVVRNAFEGEVVRTLDGKDRPVDPQMLLIADPAKGVGIAGVMGGENSEIKPETKAVLFEAAVFKSSNIRATARKLRHMTDAAARFIKGVEPVGAAKALDRAIELVAELKAGRVVGDTLDACAANLAEREVVVNVPHINRVLSTNISGEDMVCMLATLNIGAAAEGDKLRVSVPHYRTDIESGIEADWDIAEEVARVYGFYNIKPSLMRGDTFRGRLTPPFLLDDMVKDQLAAQGAYEMYNYNFTGPQTLEQLMLEPGDEKRKAVRLQNPFGEDQSLMRTTLIPGMMRVAALNLNRHTGQGRFFEVGNVHIDNGEVLAEERKMVGILHFGQGEDFYTLKGAVQELLGALGVEKPCFARGGGPYLHPGRKAQIYSGDVSIGEMGEIHPSLARESGLNERVYVCELSFAKLFALWNRDKAYSALPRYPVVQRDIALIVDEGVESAELARVIENANLGLIVEQVKLFDVFRGGTVPEGKKSMAYSFMLRAEDHTLNDDEISGAMGAILRDLEAAGARLRD